jgi:hypothetical protein
MSDLLQRRGFLRGLSTLPLIGGSVALVGNPVRADVPVTVFGVINVIMRLAPIGAFGAMAFTIGRFGIGSLAPLAALIGTFYLTSIIFVVGGSRCLTASTMAEASSAIRAGPSRRFDDAWPAQANRQRPVAERNRALVD